MVSGVGWPSNLESLIGSRFGNEVEVYVFDLLVGQRAIILQKIILCCSYCSSNTYQRSHLSHFLRWQFMKFFAVVFRYHLTINRHLSVHTRQWPSESGLISRKA